MIDGSTIKNFTKIILKSMENDGNYDYLDPSIVNKWYNCKTKSIDEKYVRFVADALGVSENEIRLGKPVHFGQEDMERIYRFLEEKGNKIPEDPKRFER